MSGFAPIRCLLLPDAPNADGEARAALLLPPAQHAIDRRPLLRVFPTIAAALAMKRTMEGDRDGHA